MSPAGPDRDRPGLLALCAFTAALLAIAFWMALHTYGDTGVHWGPSQTPYVERVERLDAGSPGADAGLHVGDLLDTQSLSPAQRLRFYAGTPAGAPITYSITRDGKDRFVSVTPWSETRSAFWRADGWDQELSIVGEFWQVFVAALLLWRRPKSADVRLLALLLVLGELSVAIAPGLNNWITPWPALDALLYTLSAPLGLCSVVLLATYAVQFGRPISRVRRIVTGTAYTLAALASLAASAATVGSWFGIVDLPTWFMNQPPAAITLALGSSLLPLGCGALALRSAHESERARLAWALGSLSINYIGSTIFGITSTLGIGTHVGAIIVDVSVFLTPLGLTYAILSRRLVDVAFALNRATVYAIVSLLVVASFSLVEWALGGWLQSASKTTNLIVAATLALALTLSIYPVHRWVDRIIDGLFFRKRHEDEKALRRFAHEAVYTTDPLLIVERAQAEIAAHTECSFCNVVIADAFGGYGGVDENDRALVALRATGAPVDLNSVVTALSGERAYPMLVRGQLMGTIVVGPKRSGESYAPDESAAIAEVARGIAVALDLIGGGRESAIPRLIDAIEALERRVQDLPDALVSRLEARKGAAP